MCYLQRIRGGAVVLDGISPAALDFAKAVAIFANTFDTAYAAYSRSLSVKACSTSETASKICTRASSLR